LLAQVFTEYGLLDTDANVSCIGDSPASTDWSHFAQFGKIFSQIQTADGKSHPVIGTIPIDVEYKGVRKPICFFIIPSKDKRVILGVDFWKQKFL